MKRNKRTALLILLGLTPGVRKKLLQKHKDAKEAREMSFKIANFGTSDVPFLTCSLRVDRRSIPVQSLLERRFQPREWGVDRCLQCQRRPALGGYQVSMYLPND